MSKPKPILPSEKEVLLWQDKSEKAVLKLLEAHYRRALRNINIRIAELNGRGDADLPHVIRRIEYQKMIKQQVKAVLDTLHAKQYETISEYLNNAYTDAFVGSVYTLHHQEIPVLVPIDQSAVVKAVTIDSKLKSDLYSELGMDMTQLKTSIAAEITRGFASGMLYDEITRNIARVTTIPLKRAKMITRTEAGRVQEQATYDAAKGAKEHGANVVKQWSAVRDGKTRDSHRALDGQVREVEEPFEVNGHKAMHPHDFGIASEDINCRCTMLTRARAALGEEDLKLMQERAAAHGLLVKDVKVFEDAKAKDFADFKKKYLKAAEEVKLEENESEPAVVPITDAIDFGYGDYSDDDYIKWMDDYDAHNAGVHLSQTELQIIDDYTEGGYIALNDVSRYSEPELLKKGYSAEDIARLREKADTLEGALAKYDLDTDIITHRFERNVAWLTGKGSEIADLESMIGKEYTAKGFTSSGMLPNRFRFTGGKSDAVHFEIVTPKGTNGAFLSMSRKGEDEFLYNRNTKFVVLDGGERVVKEAKYNIKTMKLEMVDVKERFLKVQVVPSEKAKQTQEPKSAAKGKKTHAEVSAVEMAATPPKKKWSTAAFTPAKTIEEAEGYAQRFVEKYKSKYTGNVSFKGLDLEYANELNRTLTEVLDRYEPKHPLRNIKPFNFREKQFKDTTAEAAYQWVLGDLFYNPKFYKSKKTFADYQKQVDELMKKCLGFVDEALTKKDMQPARRKFWEALKESGVQCFSQKTDDAVGGTFVHELGHYLDDNLFMKAFKEKGIDVNASRERYATKISAYAVTTRHEYVAEAFSAFWYGREDLLDPDLVTVFKETMKK